jgi:hypothetical protein
MALTICFMLAGCFHHGIKVRSARGALAVCQTELMELKFKKSASIDELIEYINQTQEMEDSIMSFSSKTLQLQQMRPCRIASLLYATLSDRRLPDWLFLSNAHCQM